MQGTADDAPMVTYRTGPKEWMKKTELPQFMREHSVIRACPARRMCILKFENCSGHMVTIRSQEGCQEIGQILRIILPTNLI